MFPAIQEMPATQKRYRPRKSLQIRQSFRSARPAHRPWFPARQPVRHLESMVGTEPDPPEIILPKSLPLNAVAAFVLSLTAPSSSREAEREPSQFIIAVAEGAAGESEAFATLSKSVLTYCSFCVFMFYAKGRLAAWPTLGMGMQKRMGCLSLEKR